MTKVNNKLKVGLALSGGGVLGGAHIGVLKALEENNIKIDFIAGTSIGAFVGGLYAFGMNIDLMSQSAEFFKWDEITTVSPSKFALLSNSKMEKFIKQNIGSVKIEDAKIPLSIICTNILDGSKVVLEKGNLSKAVMGSTAVPGIFNPVKYNELLLIDGGIVENVPISPLLARGAEFIISVDLNAKHKYEKPKNIVFLLLNSFHLMMQSCALLINKKSNLLISPNLNKFNQINKKNLHDLVIQGYNSTIELFEEINIEDKKWDMIKKQVTTT